MNRRLLMCLLALVLVLPLSGVLYAQDLSETFTASGLTLSYPADWPSSSPMSKLTFRQMQKTCQQMGLL
jgi:hypothetical protein